MTKETNNSRCPRCEGPMVPSQYIDMYSDTGELAVTCWRCLNCGEVYDPVILANRAHRPEPVERDGRKRPRVRVA